MNFIKQQNKYFETLENQTDPLIISGLKRFEFLVLEIPYHITKTFMIKLHRKVIKQVKTFINIEKIAAKNHSDAINLFLIMQCLITTFITHETTFT